VTSILWLQGAGCGGDSQSFLGATAPTVADLVTEFGLEFAWHPTLTPELSADAQTILQACAAGEEPLDILVVEGAVSAGPHGEERYTRFAGRPLADWVRDLADHAGWVVAVGS
jgi:hydrogenase small subunit